MHHSRVSSVTRRRLLRCGIVGASALATGGRVSAQNASPAASPATDEWSFTDDKGVTITLPQRPERLVIDVNAAAPLWDFGVVPTALFGWNVAADGSLGDAGGRIDPEGIPTVGNVNEPIMLEPTIAAAPDLIITLTWGNEVDPAEYWSIDPTLLTQVQGIAPVLAMSATGRADVNTLRFAELAAALGADLETPEIAQTKADMDTAIARFEMVAADKSDLTALYIHPSEASVYIANPTDWADLNMYLELGQTIVAPDVDAGMFWEEVSHELALDYPSDLLFVSTRPLSMTVEEMAASPSWGRHPAVEAGQVYPWNQDFIQSYQGMAEAITGIADAIEGAVEVVAS